MIPHDVANDEVLDYTKSLEFSCHYLLAPGCQVRLKPQQFRVLKAYLGYLQNIGNFQLEMCVDQSTPGNPGGYAVSWDNDGTAYEDDLIDAIMVDLTQNLGFVAGSILREGYITPLKDIDGRIAEIRAKLAAKHNS